jgi:hypothetical protein
MEIDITKLFSEAPLRDYSASRAELGDDAARVTWGAACEDQEDWLPPLDADQIANVRRWLQGFGAWSADEIRAMSDDHVRALLLQFIAGDIREAFPNGTDSPNWERYQADSEAGRIGGRLFPARTDGRDCVYYYVGE